jgi:dipeptidyl aminopeptidase/acylaminoacyl peptidase
MNKRIALALLSAIVTAGLVGSAQARRPMTIDDLFALQGIGEVRFSPDGSLIAVVIQRAWSDPETFRPYDMFGNDQSDVWLIPAEGGTPRNVTRGAAGGAGYWNPVWSPGSDRLAMLSTEGGDNVRVAIWNRRSEQVQLPSQSAVQTRAGTNATGSFNPIQWVDDRRVLVIALPDGEQPIEYRSRRQTQRIASEAWRRTAEGRAPSRSVLEGGLPPVRHERPDRLLLIDVESRHVRTLVEGGIKHALLSPDRQHVAIVSQERVAAPRAGSALPSSAAASSRLGLVPLREGATVRWLDTVRNPLVGFGEHPHRWSPRGQALAVIAGDGTQRSTFVVSPGTGEARRVATDLGVSAVAWTESEQLLVRGRATSGGDRADWWRVAPSGELRNLTRDLGTSPPELIRTGNANELLALANGSLWRIDLASERVRELPAGGVAPINGIIWPSAESRAQSSVSSVIVRSRSADVDAWWLVEPSKAQVSPLGRSPVAGARVADFDPQRRRAVATAAQHDDGSFLWTVDAGPAEWTRRMVLNEHLSLVTTAERRLIEYRSTDGSELNGLVLLPAGYQPGTRYPLVAFVYPGYIVRDLSSGFWVNKNQAHQDNLHLLAARGYAVLIPSMPTGGVPREPYQELQAGVLPAIDRVVELGIADADRVGLMGQSAGGYATFGLITQTARFKAAVAISGYANLASNYGTFPGQERYGDGVDEKLTQARFSETAVIGMGAPPWAAAERYVRNSPLFFLDRVETPLLIVHGDIDYVPMTQAEEVFTGLYRLGKRVRFIRYWGEGHGGADSAAHVRDRWNEVLGWLDLHLKPAA